MFVGYKAGKSHTQKGKEQNYQAKQVRLLFADVVHKRKQEWAQKQSRDRKCWENDTNEELVDTTSLEL